MFHAPVVFKAIRTFSYNSLDTTSYSISATKARHVPIAAYAVCNINKEVRTVYADTTDVRNTFFLQYLRMTTVSFRKLLPTTPNFCTYIAKKS